MPSTNYRFNIEEWLPRFPLEEEYGRYSGEIVTSPFHICNNEQLRREMQDEYDWGEPVPVDIFIMAEGEPPDRHVTKIGGLPYRPASAAWPVNSDGSAMVFLAQFNFYDSRVITGKLPGDVLLVFGEIADMPDALFFEWQPLGLNELIESDAIPKSPAIPVSPEAIRFHQELAAQFAAMGRPFPPVDLQPRTNVFAPCFGMRFRTQGFPTATRRDESRNYPRCRGNEVWSDNLLPQYQATQIGEAPYFIQRGDNKSPGKPLCAMSSVEPVRDKPYPWVNHPESLSSNDKIKTFTLGDVGCIYIFIDSDGNLDWTQSCY